MEFQRYLDRTTFNKARTGWSHSDCEPQTSVPHVIKLIDDANNYFTATWKKFNGFLIAARTTWRVRSFEKLKRHPSMLVINVLESASWVDGPLKDSTLAEDVRCEAENLSNTCLAVSLVGEAAQTDRTARLVRSGNRCHLTNSMREWACTELASKPNLLLWGPRVIWTHCSHTCSITARCWRGRTAIKLIETSIRLEVETVKVSLTTSIRANKVVGVERSYLDRHVQLQIPTVPSEVLMFASTLRPSFWKFAGSHSKSSSSSAQKEYALFKHRPGFGTVRSTDIWKNLFSTKAKLWKPSLTRCTHKKRVSLTGLNSGWMRPFTWEIQP